MLFRVRHEWYSIMTEISWMMQEIITVRWAGLLRRGKGKNIDLYQKEEKIFSACGGAAIYRKRSWKRSDI